MYPYQNFSSPYSVLAQKQEVIKVSGQNGASAYQMAPNSSILLLDINEPIVYLKQTDGAGYPSVSTFKIIPYKPESVADSLERRIKRLEELYESNIIAVEQLSARKSDESNHQSAKEQKPARTI